MPNQLLKKSINEFLPNRYTQITESHCGPAVVQMLLANVGVITSQDKIAEEGGATHTIEVSGMRVDQLAQAVHKIAPQMEFWQKEHSAIEDIKILINEFRFPVAVEWQGLFEVGAFTVTEEGADDYGHYSIVTFVDDSKLIIVDPYKDFASQDRVFTIKEFLPRWWDTNDFVDSNTGKKIVKKDEQMLFVVTPKSMVFPDKIGMLRV